MNRITRDELATELASWWAMQASDEVDMVVAKAVEYGGDGAAIDLIQIGQDMAAVMGQSPVTDEEATELGIYFYLRGKMARWTAALVEGRRVSSDTILDMGVYTRMAQRNRQVGGWPFGKRLD